MPAKKRKPRTKPKSVNFQYTTEEDKVFHEMVLKVYGGASEVQLAPVQEIQPVKEEPKEEQEEQEEQEEEKVWPSSHTYTGRVDSVESVGYNGIDAVDVGFYFVDTPKYHDFHILLTKQQAMDERISIGDQIKMTWTKFETVRRRPADESFHPSDSNTVATLGDMSLGHRPQLDGEP